MAKTPARTPIVSAAWTDRDKDAQRKRESRSESARIVIPECVNPKRRELCLEDPERFMRIYLPRKFRQPFAKVHQKLICAINDRADTGGRKAVAAPRSRGKSTIVKGMNIYLVAKQKVRFIVPICATTKLAGRLYKDFQYELAHNDLLLEDFPEICWPIRALDGAPQRAGRQHVNGKRTNIYWSSTDFCRLARVPGDANEYLKSMGLEWSPYSGVKMTYCGLDAAFRGLNIDDDRPDYLIIDDPETRESAKSHEQINNRIETIERDIEGLEGQDKPIAMMMITTIQNRYCLSSQFTDPKVRPAWDGERFGWVIKWPDRSDLWDQYIELRKTGQASGDRHGLEAIRFYLSNRHAMDEGVELISEAFKPTKTMDGSQLVFSAIQEVYNKIADTSKEAFFTEYQNDPPEESGPQGMGLTAEMVASRISGLSRRQVPANAEYITAGIDIGKYNCHWTVCAWWRGAGGVVIDYGVAEVVGNENVRYEDKAQDIDASEPAVYRCLLNWRDYLLNTEYVDAAGERRKIDMVLLDSGAYTNAVYEFCRQVRGVFRPSKGIANYRPRKQSTKDCTAGSNQHAERLASEGDIWLHLLDTDYWKQWVHERFLTPTFDESNLLRRGSLSLYQPEGSKRHLSFSQHIVAEELTREFKEGKGETEKWVAKNPNNHWLDATYLAAACTEALGITLITPSEHPIRPVDAKPKQPRQSHPRVQHGQQRFKKRTGGWIQGMRRR